MLLLLLPERGGSLGELGERGWDPRSLGGGPAGRRRAGRVGSGARCLGLSAPAAVRRLSPGPSGGSGPETPPNSGASAREVAARRGPLSGPHGETPPPSGARTPPQPQFGAVGECAAGSESQRRRARSDPTSPHSLHPRLYPGRCPWPSSSSASSSWPPPRPWRPPPPPCRPDLSRRSSGSRRTLPPPRPPCWPRARKKENERERSGRAGSPPPVHGPRRKSLSMVRPRGVPGRWRTRPWRTRHVEPRARASDTPAGRSLTGIAHAPPARRWRRPALPALPALPASRPAERRPVGRACVLIEHPSALLPACLMVARQAPRAITKSTYSFTIRKNINEHKVGLMQLSILD